MASTPAYTFEERGEAIELAFPGQRNPFLAVITITLGILFGSMVVIGTSELALSLREEPRLGLVWGVTLALLLGGTMLGLLYCLLLLTFGRHRLSIGPASLRFRQVVVLGKRAIDVAIAHEYPLDCVSNLRLNPMDRTLFTFDYRSRAFPYRRTVPFGQRLDELEAAEVWEKLQARFPGLVGTAARGVRISDPVKGRAPAALGLGLLLFGLAYTFATAWSWNPAGITSRWVEILLFLLLAVPFGFAAMRVSKAKRRDGTPVYTAQEQAFYRIFFYAATIGLGVLLLVFAVRYFFLMPRPLRGRWEELSMEKSWFGPGANGAVVDDQGNTWFATYGGISVLGADGRWSYYHAGDGLGSNWVNDIAVDRQGQVWAAVSQGGVKRFEGGTWKSVTAAGVALPGDGATDLAMDSQGNIWALGKKLWVIRQDGTVQAVDLAEYGLAIHMAIDAEDHVWLSFWSSTTIAEYDPAGQSWLAEHDVGQLDLTQWHISSKPPMIWSIAADKEDDHLWLAMEAIVELKDGQLRPLKPGYDSTAVYVDAEGYKWFSASQSSHGSNKGVLLLSPDNRHWWFYALPSRSMLGLDNIVGDNRGNYYFIGYDGIIRLSPR